MEQKTKMTPQEIDRIENAIRHIESSLDVDPWAAEIAVEAMRKQITERKTDGDTISRQAAIRVASGYCHPANIAKELEKLPSAQPEPHWIPCSERLPEESGKYLVSVLDGVGRRTTVAPYQSRYKAWTLTGRMAYWKVVAWMPLPAPYREDGEE